MLRTSKYRIQFEKYSIKMTVVIVCSSDQNMQNIRNREVKRLF